MDDTLESLRSQRDVAVDELSRTRAALFQLDHDWLQHAEQAERENAELRKLLQEWLDTELDSMDEEFQPWIDSFTGRINAALAKSRGKKP